MLLAVWPALALAQAPCPAPGEPVQWIADYCMQKMQTDDEIAVSDCIGEQSGRRFASACASNTHFKTLMCREAVRTGTRTGTVAECVSDANFRGRTVDHGGAGG